MLDLVTMKRASGAVSFVVILSLTSALVAPVSASRSPEWVSAKFPTCDKLITKYKRGVAISRSKRGKTRATVNPALYRANRKLDLNGNGVACDSEDLRLGRQWDAVQYTGVGPNVQQLSVPRGQPAIVTLSHSGTSNFVVWSLDADLEKNDLLVNEIGQYQGTVLLRRGYSYAPTDSPFLEISADGAWSITVAPASSAPLLTMGSSGTGDAVLRYGGKRTTIALTHDGTSNFAVTTHDIRGLYGDLLVNEIGSFSGRVVLPSDAYVEIDADGNWSISR